MHRPLLKAALLSVAAGLFFGLAACQTVPERHEGPAQGAAAGPARDQPAGVMANNDADRIRAQLEAEDSRSGNRPPVSGRDRTGRSTVDQPRPTRR